MHSFFASLSLSFSLLFSLPPPRSLSLSHTHTWTQRNKIQYLYRQKPQSWTQHLLAKTFSTAEGVMKLDGYVSVIYQLLLPSFISFLVLTSVYWITAGVELSLHLITHTHTVGLIWTRDQSVPENFPWQHTTFTWERLKCPRWDFMPQS